MTQEHFAALPEQLTVRVVKIGRRVIVTTMLDHHSVSKGELQALYGHRWHVELDLRNIKTTLGMDVVSCHTPQMNEKEFWVHLLAYNLIRLLRLAGKSQFMDMRELKEVPFAPGRNDHDDDVSACDRHCALFLRGSRGQSSGGQGD
jgi:DDE family transposase